MRIAFCFLLVACSKPSNCPTVDEITRAGDGDAQRVRREYEIVVKQCRADTWSAGVIECLRDAKTYDAQEPCFRQLSANQQERLATAFGPIEKEYEDDERALLRTKDAQFATELEDLRVSELATRAPACQGYLDAIAKGRKTLLACPEPDALRTYGFQQMVLASAKKLQAMQDPTQLAAACVEAAKSLDEKCE